MVSAEMFETIDSHLKSFHKSELPFGRAAEDPPFAELLLRLRKAKLTAEDVDTLSQRTCCARTITQDHEATHLFPRRAQVAHCNADRTELMPGLVEIATVNTGRGSGGELKKK
eukprot:2680527-Amphidinium_carterae.1